MGGMGDQNRAEKMNHQQVIFGLLEFVISICVSFILIFGSYRLFLVFTRRLDEEKKLQQKNISIGILLGSVFLGEAIIVKQAIYPVMAVIQLYVLGEDKTTAGFARMMGLSIGYMLLAGILALLCILFSFWLFNRMTPRIDQFAEIKNNNTAVAVFMALFIISLCLLMSAGVSGLTRALIPFPAVGSIPLT